MLVRFGSKEREKKKGTYMANMALKKGKKNLIVKINHT
jgi:hypothetical protein